ncbi:MAG: rod shape-determining protein RodA [Candidatus Omnitrophica bacterium]|nr:rod shape-determining protein RodA [Candidatus Omnitrophota bacterium]
MFRSKIWFNIDYVSLLLALGLASFGVVVLAGATQGTINSGLWLTQAQWIVIGLIMCVCTFLIDYRFFIKYAVVFYIIGIIGLLLCFAPYIGLYKKGAYSWIRIGPKQFQPAEFAKLATILMLAKILGSRKEKWTGMLDILRPLFIGALPAMIILKQPDLGTAIVFGPVTLLMMFAAGMPFSYILLLFAPFTCFIGINHDIIAILIWLGIMGGLLLYSIFRKIPWTVWLPFLAISIVAYIAVFEYAETVWNQLRDHQKDRIVGYFNPEIEKKGLNWNIYNSKVALGSGGFWGIGLGKGTQSKLGFLPEYEHDFVFPTVGEQLGFVGGVSLLGLFLFLLMRALETSILSKTLQGSLIATGVAALFFSHISINIGMVTGLLPVTGLPLTFISYGGSFMLINMIAVGFLISIRMHTTKEIIEDNIMNNHPQLILPKNTENGDIWESS